MTVVLEKSIKGAVCLRVDSYRGKVIAAANTDVTTKELTFDLTSGVVGKHAVYFEFVSEDKEDTYTFDRFSFD